MSKKVYMLQLTLLSLTAVLYPFIQLVERRYRSTTYDPRFNIFVTVFFPLAFGILLSFANICRKYHLINITFFLLNLIIAAIMWFAQRYPISAYNLIILGLLFFNCFYKKAGREKQDVES